MSIRSATRALGVATVAVAITGTGISFAGAAVPAPDKALLHEIRTATARYHSPAQAERDGYVKDSPCESSEAGGMGFHYINISRILDPKIDPTEPEVLLYAPSPSGRVQLVGVEYLKFAADGDDRPFLGTVPFNGPMPGHTDQMPIHYDLHVWLYEKNPSGTFAPWNPSVTC